MTDLMAMQAGLPSAEYGFIGPGSRRMRELYLKAVIAGYGRNYDPLTDFLVEALERGLTRVRDM